MKDLQVGCNHANPAMIRIAKQGQFVLHCITTNEMKKSKGYKILYPLCPMRDFSDLAHSMTADTGSVSLDRVSINLLKPPSLATRSHVIFTDGSTCASFLWQDDPILKQIHFCRWVAMVAMTQRRLRWAWVILGGAHAGQVHTSSTKSFL